MTAGLLYEAVSRTIDILSDNPTEHVDGKLMTIVAIVGFLVNVVDRVTVTSMIC